MLYVLSQEGLGKAVHLFKEFYDFDNITYKNLYNKRKDVFSKHPIKLKSIFKFNSSFRSVAEIALRRISDETAAENFNKLKQNCLYVQNPQNNDFLSPHIPERKQLKKALDDYSEFFYSKGYLLRQYITSLKK